MTTKGHKWKRGIVHIRTKLRPQNLKSHCKANKQYDSQINIADNRCLADHLNYEKVVIFVTDKPCLVEENEYELLPLHQRTLFV